jgi:hypothetical protein
MRASAGEYAAFNHHRGGATEMWIVLVGGLMITLPATAVILFSFGTIRMIPALVSLSLNLLPFVVAYILMRKVGGEHGHDIDH